MVPIIPQSANNWLSSPNANAALGTFPYNLVGYIPEELQREIMTFINQNYAWPQVMERMAFEPMWDTIVKMYRIKMDKVDLSIEEASKAGQQQKSENDAASSGPEVRVADSVVFDAIERLTNIHHFVSFKEGIPIQYNIPKYFDTRSEDAFYHPFRDKIKAGNALLQWNFDNEDIYRKHEIVTRHFYTYGVAFVLSEFQFLVQMVQRMYNNGQVAQIPEIMKIGTSFEPISIRKLWLNYRLNAFDMDYQPCPFFFNETPRFATLQNVYNPQTNPFGFDATALARLAAESNQISWLYSEPEMASLRTAIQGMLEMQSKASRSNLTLPNLLNSEFSVDALWTYYPMLPLDPQTLEWKVRKDGSAVPYSRFIVNSFGQNLAGKQILLRLQRNFYPRDTLPLYGTSHMPDLDSGLYTPSLGYLLWNHYKEIVTCKAQYLANKDWINNPPSWVQASSPAANQDLTKSGQKIEVNGPNDFGWRQPFDATASTVNMMIALRDQAKTSSKSDDALMGKALGGRTSATEANNAFQASMSAVTTPINLFNFDIMGGYAVKVWEYTGTWFPPELLKRITGQMGFALTPEDLWTRIGLKWDVGSTYVESIVRQQNIRYMLESSMGDPTINRAPMWRELLEEWRFDTAAEWVNDGGFEREVYVATSQAISTFQGKQVIVNPDQNHQIAMKVKTRFIEDVEGPFMSDPNMRANAPALLQQIQIHQRFLLLQMHQQMLQQKVAAAGGPPPDGGQPQAPSQQPPLSDPNIVASLGQMAQQGGGRLN
jgi:hypothetical protein